MLCTYNLIPHRPYCTQEGDYTVKEGQTQEEEAYEEIICHKNKRTEPITAPISIIPLDEQDLNCSLDRVDGDVIVTSPKASTCNPVKQVLITAIGFYIVYF